MIVCGYSLKKRKVIFGESMITPFKRQRGGIVILRKIGKGNGKHWRIAALVMLLLIACSGCTGSGKKYPEPDKDQKQETAAQTDALTEAVSEEETEEVEYRSIREMLDEETLAWADSFDEKKIVKMEYTILEEEPVVYTVTDPEKIREFFDAIMEIQVAGVAELYASPAGDSFAFYTDEENSVQFHFHMGCLRIGEEKYETDDADTLWELTGYLMFPEELGTEN